MKSLALEPHSNSFIRVKNRFRFTESHLEYMALRVRSVISIFLGEWFLDQTLGIPYIPKNDMKKGHRALIETALMVKITAIKGIKKLIHFYTVYEPGERELFVDFAAETDNGEILKYKEKQAVSDFGGNK